MRFAGAAPVRFAGAAARFVDAAIGAAARCAGAAARFVDDFLSCGGALLLGVDAAAAAAAAARCAGFAAARFVGDFRNGGGFLFLGVAVLARVFAAALVGEALASPLLPPLLPHPSRFRARATSTTILSNFASTADSRATIK